MNCPSEDELLSLTDDSTADQTRAAIIAHIEHCSACQQLAAMVVREARPAAAEVFLPNGLQRGRSLGRYVILERLGAGGMGVVFSAFDTELERKIALKVLHTGLFGTSRDQLHERLVGEAKLVAQLSHPNVISVFDVGEIDGHVFMSMDLIEGHSLRSWLHLQHRSWREIVSVFVAAAAGLSAAHRAGLVHCDFKPDNVLVGVDGRVKVTDFGLARMLTATTSHAGLTGTLGYMSPEQLACQSPDARSDQFALCVALYEALYGCRPFSGTSIEELGSAIANTQPSFAARSSQVPYWLRRALARGLRPAASERFASLDDLVAILSSHTAQRSRAAWALGGALVTTLVVAAIQAYALSANAQRCTGVDPALAAVWNASAREKTEAAFLATHEAYAATAFARVDRSMQQFVSDSVRLRRDACEATHLRGDQALDVLELRMACYGQRLSEVRALTAMYSAIDVEHLARSTSAIEQVTELSLCSDVSALKSPARAPTPALRAQVADVQSRLSQVAALFEAGHFSEARRGAEPLLTQAKGLGYRPLEAEAGLLVSRSQFEDGHPELAEASFNETIVAAEAGGHDYVLARSYQLLGLLTAGKPSRYFDTRRALDHSEAIIERLGGNERLSVWVANTRALAEFTKRDYGAAKSYAERAIQLGRRVVGPDSRVVASTSSLLGSILTSLGDAEAATARHREAAAILEALDGPNHPDVAKVLNNLARAELSLGNFEVARQVNERAYTIRLQALGGEHSLTAWSLLKTAEIETELGHFAAALTHAREARATLAKALGPEAERVTAAMALEATVLSHLQQHAAARELLESTIALQRKSNSPELASTLTAYGQAFLRAQLPAKAVPPLSEAVSRIEDMGAHPLELASALFSRGQCLWPSHKDEAISDVVRAQQLWRGARGHTRQMAEIAAWLASHDS